MEGFNYGKKSVPNAKEFIRAYTTENYLPSNLKLVGGQEDEVKVYEYAYRRSVESGGGDFRAVLLRAYCLENGCGTAKDIQAAAAFLVMLTSEKYVPAIYQMAKSYFGGVGVKASLSKAAELFLEAANLGYVAAEYDYAMMLMGGYGIDRNLEDAKKWLDKAAEHGYEPAQQILGAVPVTNYVEVEKIVEVPKFIEIPKYVNTPAVSATQPAILAAKAKKKGQETRPKTENNKPQAIGAETPSATKKKVNPNQLIEMMDSLPSSPAVDELRNRLKSITDKLAKKQKVKKHKTENNGNSQKPDNVGSVNKPKKKLKRDSEGNKKKLQNGQEVTKLKKKSVEPQKLQRSAGVQTIVKPADNQQPKQNIAEMQKNNDLAAKLDNKTDATTEPDVVIDLETIDLELPTDDIVASVQTHNVEPEDAPQPKVEDWDIMPDLEVPKNGWIVSDYDPFSYTRVAVKSLEELKKYYYLGGVHVEALRFIAPKIAGQLFDYAVEAYEANPDSSRAAHICAKFLEIGYGTPKDISSSLGVYEALCAKNYAPAKFTLSRCYLNGIGLRQNIERGIDLLKAAADANDAFAQCEMGNCFMNGVGVEKDARKALDNYLLAARQGDAVAASKTGDCYLNGIGSKVDAEVACTWHAKAAEQGIIRSQCAYGQCLIDGIGIEKNVEEGRRLLEKAEQAGSGQASYVIGRLKQESGDFDGAVESFKLAADNGSSDAMCVLSAMASAEDKQEEAVNWLIVAADKNNHEAQFKLGDAYERGIGIAADITKAMSLYEKSANGGYMEAQFRLGNIYASSKMGVQNNEQSAKWYLEAANNGNKMAAFNIANCLYNGVGTAKNDEAALKWFLVAAESGIVDAMTSVATCCFNGIGTEVDSASGFEWLQKAASAGHVGACVNLAACFERGDGAAQSYELAFKWYQVAANKGVNAAKIKMAEFYEDGKGVKRDKKLAREILISLAQSGDVAAQKKCLEMGLKFKK